MEPHRSSLVLQAVVPAYGTATAIQATAEAPKYLSVPTPTAAADLVEEGLVAVAGEDVSQDIS